MIAVSVLVKPRPFVKWVGGKSQLIPQYTPYFPKKYRNYYEPFVGGGAIFFHLQPEKSHLFDINLELVNAYRCVRDRVDELIDLLDRHQQQHSPEHYYEVRSQHADSDAWFNDAAVFPQIAIDRAARLIYLNKTCFNGLHRENKKGEFNVPMGSYEDPTICDRANLKAASIALQGVKIGAASFEEILEYANSPDDFVFFDPPYHPIDKASFRSYTKGQFAELHQLRLRDVVKRLSDRGVKVMLSNSDCEFIRELYKDFNIHTVYASRSINSNAEKRGKITEVLVTNYAN